MPAASTTAAYSPRRRYRHVPLCATLPEATPVVVCAEGVVPQPERPPFAGPLASATDGPGVGLGIASVPGGHAGSTSALLATGVMSDVGTSATWRNRA